jgi:HAD superfamily hydrolase (TIGR01509 family)
MTSSKALIFDCDGVLIDAEQLGHLRAFNQMWQEFHISWTWTVEQYAHKLAISGGRERLASLRDDADFRSVYQVPEGIEAWEAVVEQWHQRKTEIYVRLVSAGRLPPRSGVRRLAHEALSAGWRLAVVSSGSPESVRAAVRLVFGPELAPAVVVVDGGWAVRKKPSAEPYTAVADALGVRTRDCVVVEDSATGLLAARGAGAACVVTPTRLTLGQDFAGAALVMSELGEPTGPPVAVLSNPLHIGVEDFLRLDSLSDLLAAHERAVKDALRGETSLTVTRPELLCRATGAQRIAPTLRNS